MQNVVHVEIKGMTTIFLELCVLVSVHDIAVSILSRPLSFLHIHF